MAKLDPWAAIEWPETHLDPWAAIAWPTHRSSMAVVLPPDLKEPTSPTAHLFATNPWTPILQSSLDSASSWPISTHAFDAWVKSGIEHIRNTSLPEHGDAWIDGKENMWDGNVNTFDGNCATSILADRSACADRKKSPCDFDGDRSLVSSEKHGRPGVCRQAQACTSSPLQASSLEGRSNKTRKTQKKVSWGSAEVREYEIPKGAFLHQVCQ
eukprot:TRINITY_DN89598_c0_g1_i1.p1 TRINITY_DN89598_c0_g1~~TRINITY_DN89598_c0_g1_i1.p1  ORF type:complete len:229 (-),score=22.30 TRINITY_DN89598_c0_g1_i1:148-783(-)